MLNHNNIFLITTNALDYPPCVFHRAILFYDELNNPTILHKTTSGVEMIGFDKFMQGRHILFTRSYPIKNYFDPYHVLYSYKQKGNDFDWMNNNCEDFTSDMVEQISGQKVWIKSPQRLFWIIITAIILITMIIIKM